MRALWETATHSNSMPGGIPVVFPTLTGRARGIFRQASDLDQGLVLFPETTETSSPLRKALSLLSLYGQMAGVNVLEVSGGNGAPAQAHENIDEQGWLLNPDPGRPLAISLLAAVTYLRAQGINHIVLVYPFDVTSLLRLHELSAYLLSQSLSVSGVLSTDIAEFTQHLDHLSDMALKTVESICGIACLQSDALAEVTSYPTINLYLCSLPERSLLSDTVDVWPAVQSLYRWLITVLSVTTPQSATQANGRAAQTIPMRPSAKDAQRISARRHAAEVAIAYHRSSADIRTTMGQRLRDLQLQWEALCLDLAERNRFKGNAIKKALLASHSQESRHIYDEKSSFVRMMRDVRRCWPLLDTPARRRWLAVWTRAVVPDQEPFLSTYLPTDE